MLFKNMLFKNMQFIIEENVREPSYSGESNNVL